MKKFNWKIFLLCLALVISLGMSVASPILYFVVRNDPTIQLPDEQTDNVVKTGKNNPTSSTLGREGDLYLNTETGDLFEMTGNGWTKVGNFKGPQGDQGPQRQPGQQGTPGSTGENGKDGTNVYMGYDGHIWKDAVRTDWYIPGATVGEDVFEHTLEVAEVMKKYYNGDHVDLSSNYIALMPYYQKNSNLTLFSGMEVTEITVYAQNEGPLQVGTAKIEDIENIRTNGGSLNVANSKKYQVQQGKTTITFETSLKVGENETIVLGGDGSVALYYAKNIPVNDEAGNFTVIDSESHDNIISKQEDSQYDDTLAVQVRVDTVVEKPIFANLQERLKAVVPTLSTLTQTGNEYYGAYMYGNEHIFSGRTITKIGSPVKDIRQVDGRTYLGLYLIDAYDSPLAEGAMAERNYGENQEKTDTEEKKAAANKWLDEHRLEQVLEIPASKFQETKQHLTQTGGDWLYFDCNIEVGANQTLAFCGHGHGVDWFYINDSIDNTGITEKPEYDELKIIGKVGNNQAHGYSGTVEQKQYMFFDVYYSEEYSLAEQIENIEQREYDASWLDRLAVKLAGKKLSILGDSISTYEGYSNEYETQNSNIKDNGTWGGDDHDNHNYRGNKQCYFKMFRVFMKKVKTSKKHLMFQQLMTLGGCQQSIKRA